MTTEEKIDMLSLRVLHLENRIRDLEMHQSYHFGYTSANPNVDPVSFVNNCVPQNINPVIPSDL